MRTKVSFPLIIAIFREAGFSVPEDIASHLKEALKLRGADSKVILIYAASDPDLARLVQRFIGEGVESRAFDASNEIEIIETCTSLVWLGEGPESERLLAYAKAIGRNVCTVSRDGKIDGLEGLEKADLHASDYCER